MRFGRTPPLRTDASDKFEASRMLALSDRGGGGGGGEAFLLKPEA